MKQYVFITFILGFVWNSYLINQRWTLHPPFWEKLLFSYIVLMCSWKCFWLLMILYSYRDNNYTVFVSFLVWTLFFLGCIKLVTLITSVFLAKVALTNCFIDWSKFVACFSESLMMGWRTEISYSNHDMRNGWIACPTRRYS